MTDNRSAARTDALCAWITQQGIDGTSFDDLLEGLCAELLDAGLPLLRMNLSMRALHPEIGAFAYRWKRKSGMIREEYARNTATLTGWDQSPLKVLVEGADNELRYALHEMSGPMPFPVFEDLVQMGGTDYFAQQLPMSRWEQSAQSRLSTDNGLMASWVSDASDGFSEDDLDLLRGLLPSLGLALKSMANLTTARDLLGVYLGGDAGRRVMSGDILRGSLDKIRCAILYFDLQGFTRLSEALEPETLIEMLNAYFGEVVGIVESHGGNVLKFMGDGMLAIFSEVGDGQSRLAALDAVAEVRDAMKAVNARRADEGLPVTGFCAALHAGEVLYGNIGGPTRLDFTVIGPAVNAASRILGMCSGLDQNILVSSIIAKPALELRPALVSVGQYRLRGVTDRMELFTLD